MLKDGAVNVRMVGHLNVIWDAVVVFPKLVIYTIVRIEAGVAL